MSCVLFFKDIPNPPRNVTVTVELSNQNGESMAVMPSDRSSSKDVIANKRLKLVIRWMHANGKLFSSY